MAKTGSRLQEEELRAKDEADKLETLNAKVKTKLENYQELYDHNQRMIRLGNKVNSVAERYFSDQKKRPLVSELLRIVETENSKRKRKSAKESKSARQLKAKVEKEIQQEMNSIRKEKNRRKVAEANSKNKKTPKTFKIGDRVRLIDGRAVGSIDSLEKNKAIVNYGTFITNVSVGKLELVEASKKR